MAGWFALSLVLEPHRPAAHAWAEAFGCGALGAFFGAMSHGLAGQLSPRVQRTLWRAALIFTGAAAIMFAVATGQSAAPRQEDLIMGAGLIALAVYVVLVIVRPTFGITALVSVVSLTAIFVSAIAISRSSPTASAWILAGVALTAFGFWIQRARISLHRHLNNNDLYHVLQLIALICLYRAAVTLT